MKKFLQITTVGLVVGLMSVSSQAALVGCKTSQGVKACVDITNKRYSSGRFVMNVQGVATASGSWFGPRWVQNSGGKMLGFVSNEVASTAKSAKVSGVDANVSYRSVTRYYSGTGYVYSNYVR